MGLKWPWEDTCEETIVDDNGVVYSLTGSFDRINLATAFVITVCQYKDAQGNITTREHVRVLWVFDF
jgi:hypothetical protein